MTSQQLGFDPDALVELAALLREAAGAASAITVAVGQAERRAAELGAPAAGPTGFFDALDYLAFDAPTVRGLRTVALDAPVLAAEVERRTAHLAAAEQAARLGWPIDTALWFSDAAPPRLGVVRASVVAIECRFAPLAELDFAAFDDLGRVLADLTPAERQAVVGGLSASTFDRACDQLRQWFFKIVYSVHPLPWGLRARLLGMMGMLLAAAPADRVARLLARVPAADPAFDGVSALDTRQFPVDDWAAGMYLREVDGELIENGVSPDDVRQRALGDCWFVAGLVAVAHVAPGLLADHVRDNGNGTVTVTFYRGGEAVPVTVTSTLPYAPIPGQYPFAVDGAGFGVGEAWGPLYEKAFAQLYGSYGAIEGGRADEALPQLVGRPSDGADPDEVSQERLAGLLATGHAVTLGTGRRWLGLFGTDPGPLTGRHVYAVLRVLGDGTVVLRDPRNLGPGTEIELPWSTVQDHADELAWVPTR